VKEFLENILAAGETAVIIGLEFNCAFEAAWWPSI